MAVIHHHFGLDPAQSAKEAPSYEESHVSAAAVAKMRRPVVVAGPSCQGCHRFSRQSERPSRLAM